MAVFAVSYLDKKNNYNYKNCQYEFENFKSNGLTVLFFIQFLERMYSIDCLLVFIIDLFCSV